MKEKFERRLLTGNFKVKCEGRIWQDTKEKVIEHIVATVERYAAMGLRLTLRQLHYQFVINNWIVNHLAAYKKLGVILDDCRYAGIIDWDDIVDRGRTPRLPYWSHNVADALDDTLQQYRVNRMANQDNHIEVWTEKDALSEIISNVTDKWHVRLCVNKGYTSSSAAYGSYERFVKHIQNEQKVTVLYLGDHDPSGLDMVRDIRERLMFMLSNGTQLGYEVSDDELEIIPIGLTMEQIKKYKCPPNPAKLTDTRSPKYIKQFGKMSWEVDALPPEALVKIIDSNISKLVDMNVYEKELKRERDGRKELETFIKAAKK